MLLRHSDNAESNAKTNMLKSWKDIWSDKILKNIHGKKLFQKHYFKTKLKLYFIVDNSLLSFSKYF